MRALSLALSLAAVVGFGWIALLPWMTESAQPPDLSRDLPTGAATPPSFAEDEPRPTDLTSFTARPLFSAARRPPPPEAPGIAIEEPESDLLFGRYEVAGAIVLGERAIALLRDADGALLRLGVGEGVPTGKSGDGRAVVKEITLDSLTFEHEGATVTAPVGKEEKETE